MSCWIRLGIEPTTDETLIRSAYRARLPAHHPETDPEGFQALRMAYESALRLAREEEEEAGDEIDAAQANVVRAPQAFLDFCALLDDPRDDSITRRGRHSSGRWMNCHWRF